MLALGCFLAACVVASSAQDTAFDAFLSARGATLNGVALRTVGLSRGVFATRDLPRGHEICLLPLRRALVNVEHVFADSPLADEIRKAEARLGYNVFEPAAVGLFLARAARFGRFRKQRGTEEQGYLDTFAPYARWLAVSDVDGSPVLWRDESDTEAEEMGDVAAGWAQYASTTALPQHQLVDWLVGTSILRNVREWRRMIEENWRDWGRAVWFRTMEGVSSATTTSALGATEERTWLRLFMFWVSVVQGRVHGVMVRDQSGTWVKTKCMVPFADAINTGPPETLNVKCFTNDASTHFVCRTTGPVKAGEELLTAYSGGGGHHNTSAGRYFMNYGFAAPWMLAESALMAEQVWIGVDGLHGHRDFARVACLADLDLLVGGPDSDGNRRIKPVLDGVERALEALGRNATAIPEGQPAVSCWTVREAERRTLLRMRDYLWSVHK